MMTDDESFLSLPVRKKIRLLSIDECNYSNTTTLSPENLVNWNAISDVLKSDNHDIHSELWYEDMLSQLSPLMHETAENWKNGRRSFREENMKWMGHVAIENFHRCSDISTSDAPGSPLLSTLLITSTLERLLGDVYLLKNRPVPSMLKQLLESQELKDVFGESTMMLLQILIGPPISLNLRNLVWHGFISADEMPKQVSFFLLSIISTLGKVMRLKVIVDHQRPLVSMSDYERKLENIFPVMNVEDCVAVEELLSKSVIARSRFTGWKGAFVAYKEHRFADCAILIVPELENILKKLYTVANKCPHRLLTAESSVLYTTFDEILDEHIGNEINQLRNCIGDNLMVMLFDLLSFPGGPRFRDHLSHGEVDLTSITREFCNYVMSISIACSFKTITDTDIQQTSYLQCLFKCVDNYSSRFGPIVLLHDKICELCDSLNQWKKCEIVDMKLENVQQKTNANELLKSFKLNDHMTVPLTSLQFQIERELQTIYKSQSRFTFDELQSYVCKMDENTLITNLLSSIKLNVLYSNARILEMIKMFQNVIEALLTSSEQIVNNLKTRQEEILNHRLRSRQRMTYARMIESLPMIFIGLKLSSVVVVSFCTNSDAMFEKLNKKICRSLVHYGENLKSLTHMSKNRWLESKELTETFVTTISSQLSFTGRQMRSDS